MKTTTAQKFGSLGKSFKSPSAAAAVLGAALLASGTTDDAETAWSPAAACLLPDVLPVAGTLLSYGGSRQLAAGGTVTHSGSLDVGSASDVSDSGGVVTVRRWRNPFIHIDANTAQGGMWGLTFRIAGNERAGLKIDNNSGEVRLNVGSGGFYPTIYSNGVQRMVINTAGDTTFAGAITASGNITIGSAVSGQVYGLQIGNGVAAGSDFCYLRLPTNWGNIDFKSWGRRLGLYGTGLSQVVSPAFTIDSTGSFSAASGSAFSAEGDTFISRASAGVWRFGTTSTGTDAGIQCGAITASGAIQETPTQSALDPTTTNIPSGKRQGWYNSTLAEFRDWVNIGGTLLKSAAYT